MYTNFMIENILADTDVLAKDDTYQVNIKLNKYLLFLILIKIKN